MAAHCERCAELAERIAWLESELGLQRDADGFARLRAAIPVGGPQSRAAGVARLLGALFSARGRTLSCGQIVERIPSPSGNEDRDTKLAAVYVCDARRTFGRGIIETVWGKGYRLTPSGMALVASILSGEPQQAAA